MIQCCPKPEWSMLSDRKFDINESTGRYEQVAIKNSICLRCNSHLYGEGEGMFYTRKQWDSWINSAFEEPEAANQGLLFA